MFSHIFTGTAAPQPAAFSVAQLHRLLEQTALAMQAAPPAREALRFHGVISTADERAGADGMMYRLEVADSRDPAQIIRLRLPLARWRALGLNTGAGVTVTGMLDVSWAPKWSALVCVVDVLQLEADVPPPNAPEAFFDLQAFLRKYPCRRHRFPAAPRCISVVYPKHSADRCLREFRKKLPASAPELETLPVNILDGADIARAVCDASGDLLVLLRGGGTREGFACFDEPDVLIAVIEKDIFTLTGLGHADNATYTDLIADYAALTPTDAGIFLHDSLEEQWRLRQAGRQNTLAAGHSRRLWVWLLAAGLLLTASAWLWLRFWR